MKTKLTPKLQEEICRLLKRGCNVEVAAECVGISKRTYNRWLGRGQKAIELQEKGKEVPESEKIFSGFCQSVRHSVFKGKGKDDISTIISQIGPDWRVVLNTLENKYLMKDSKFLERLTEEEYLGFKSRQEYIFSKMLKDQKHIPIVNLLDLSICIAKSLNGEVNENENEKFKNIIAEMDEEFPTITKEEASRENELAIKRYEEHCRNLEKDLEMVLNYGKNIKADDIEISRKEEVSKDLIKMLRDAKDRQDKEPFDESIKGSSGGIEGMLILWNLTLNFRCDFRAMGKISKD